MDRGTLYIVSTPIGNLKDITLRAIDVLKHVDIIVCEDSRRALIIVNEYLDRKKKLLIYHDHNKEEMTPKIITHLEEGKDIALTTDAGTPIISDPGYYLLREAIRKNIKVVPVPGPSAILSAIVVSGLPPDRWVFEGYLKRRKGRKRKQLEELKDEKRTMVFFESPFRLIDTLNLMLEVFGNRRVAVCREMTKVHEEILRGNIEDVIEVLSKRKKIRGEITLVVEGRRDD